MSLMLANWEQVHVDIEVAADSPRVLWPSDSRDRSIWGYQPGIVLQNLPKRI